MALCDSNSEHLLPVQVTGSPGAFSLLQPAAVDHWANSWNLWRSSAVTPSAVVSARGVWDGSTARRIYMRTYPAFSRPGRQPQEPPRRGRRAGSPSWQRCVVETRDNKHLDNTTDLYRDGTTEGASWTVGRLSSTEQTWQETRNQGRHQAVPRWASPCFIFYTHASGRSRKWRLGLKCCHPSPHFSLLFFFSLPLSKAERQAGGCPMFSPPSPPLISLPSPHKIGARREWCPAGRPAPRAAHDRDRLAATLSTAQRGAAGPTTIHGAPRGLVRRACVDCPGSDGDVGRLSQQFVQRRGETGSDSPVS